jgi:hypothetical protein
MELLITYFASLAVYGNKLFPMKIQKGKPKKWKEVIFRQQAHFRDQHPKSTLGGASSVLAACISRSNV